jgi:hypothetical protein
VEQRLADRLKPFLPAGTIQATWQGLEQQFGAFQEVGPTSAVQTPQGLVQVVVQLLEMVENSTSPVQTSFRLFFVSG